MEDEATLPSYGEAISSDWLPLVAPYLPATLYARLCLVSRSWYGEFAPRLWRDPLQTIRALGLDPADDLDWYSHFFFAHLLNYGGKDERCGDSQASTPYTWNSGDYPQRLALYLRKSRREPLEGVHEGVLVGSEGAGPHPGDSGVRETTRALVLSADFRKFAIDTYDFRSDDNDRIISKSLALFPHAFPRIRCILLDGHADADATCLAQAHVCGHHLDCHNHHDQTFRSPPAPKPGTTDSGSSLADSPSTTRGFHGFARSGNGSDVSHAIRSSGAAPQSSSHSGFIPPPRQGSGAGPLLLSLSHYPVHLPTTTFFDSPYLRGLVYLDISHAPGSLRASIQAGSLAPAKLPDLRILKTGGREMDDATLAMLTGSFMSRIWSLNLAGNNLSDASLESLASCSFAALGGRSPAHFEVEGMLGDPECSPCSDAHGPFKFVVESKHSGTFDHPERYLADAPIYSSQDHTRDETWAGPGSVQARGLGTGRMGPARADGLHPIRDDSVDHVKRVFEESGSTTSDISAYAHLRDGSSGLTHLYLSGNSVTAGLTSRGLERLMLAHPGTLQRLDCDTLAFQPAGPSSAPPAQWPSLSGIMDVSYAFRPAVASDLRELRVHHSIVTQVPTLERTVRRGGLSQLARLWVAENTLAPRVDMAYPGSAWQPDMNPRLTVLTLARIPRRSSGRVIRSICKFIKLAAIQEGTIQECESGKRRGVPVLKGLRCLRLEFESDPSEGMVGDDDEGGNLDAGDLLELKEDEFCFFEDENKPKSKSNPGALSPNTTGGSSRSRDSSSSFNFSQSAPEPMGAQLKHYPYAQGPPPKSAEQADHSRCYLEYPCQLTGGRTVKVHVWIGDGMLRPSHPALNEYMRRVQDRGMRAGIGPAAPPHVRAGVPAGSFIFRVAWDAMVVPPQPPSSPGKEELARCMVDTLESIKAYRRNTSTAFEAAKKEAEGKVGKAKLGAPHFHWGGKIEVVLNTDVSNREYWPR